MKFGIFVCILVVLTAHEAVGDRRAAQASFPALLEGNCKPEDVPGNVLQSCSNIKCEKTAAGEISLERTGCSLSLCPNGKEIGQGPYDLTKRYPACCNYMQCD